MGPHSRFGLAAFAALVLAGSATPAVAGGVPTAVAEAGLLTGHVRDGSGHGWPVRAKVSMSGSVTYSDPSTGAFRLDVPAGTVGEVSVDPVYPGYETSTTPVTVAADGTAVDLEVTAETETCRAPGYRLDGMTEGFDTPATTEGWQVVDHAGTGNIWRFDDPGGRGNLTGGSGGFAIADHDAGSAQAFDSSLISPKTDLSGVAEPELQFSSDLRDLGSGTASASVSVDGGQTWTAVWSKSGGERGPITHVVPLPAAADQPDVKVRFNFTGGIYWFAVDDVFVGKRGCLPVEGGLVAGTASDQNTGAVVAGVRARVDGAVMASPSSDPGFYWGFLPTGEHTVAVDSAEYVAEEIPVRVSPDEVATADVSLAAGRLEVAGAGIDATVPWGETGTQQITVTNTGTAPATVGVRERDRGFALLQPDGTTEPPERLDDDWAPAAPAPQNQAWSRLPSLPMGITENIAGDHDGDLYSFGGASADRKAITDGWVLRDRAGAWQPTAPMPEGRLAAAGGFVDGTMVMVGGWVDNRQHLASQVLRYSPKADSWSTGAASPQALAGSGSAIMDGVVYTVGGCTTVCGNNSVLAYDVAADEFRRLADYPVKVSWPSCGAVDGRIVCAGGADTDDYYGVNGATWIYDPATDTWTEGAHFPGESWGATTWTSGGRLVAAGGMYAGFPTRDAWAYDPGQDRWSQLPWLNTLLYRGGSACGVRVGGASAGYTGKQDVFVLSGYDGCDPGTTDVGWVSSAPEAGTTLQPGESVTMTLTADPAGAGQPGDLAAQLGLVEDTPYPVSPLAVTMRVPAPKDWGFLQGTVTAKACDGTPAPLAGATVQVDGVSSGWTLTTTADGRYRRWIDKDEKQLQLVVGHDGYEIETRLLKAPKSPVDVATEDFSLTRTGC
ncbi:kelch repeat-containing protein [Nocardioides albus]|uniref:N-acetylneuraminic acid mutarotase n=1 Tax=Nocardioides albus TaxID=1841 RepID=A0A7W5F9C0_9ACTN|nr:kelch repeat-containing protein [Nocardioides albus]MBB3090144.1 N-acetylneuraminic acid mutarotase [Nocardioides albus]GGU27989.1 hypothetical protein GCM10007979_28520 [Nocardioides albus]